MTDLAPVGRDEDENDGDPPTLTARVLLDAFDRISQEVDAVLDELDEAQLTARPTTEANSIAWLVWHLTRIQDDHVAAAFGHEQVWTSGSWDERFGLPFPTDATGYGHSSDDVAAVSGPVDLFRSYHHAVSERTADVLGGLRDAELERIVDERWDPPVTLAVRLVSVVADDLQHVGQAAYLRGLLS